MKYERLKSINDFLMEDIEIIKDDILNKFEIDNSTLMNNRRNGPLVSDARALICFELRTKTAATWYEIADAVGVGQASAIKLYNRVAYSDPRSRVFERAQDLGIKLLFSKSDIEEHELSKESPAIKLISLTAEEFCRKAGVALCDLRAPDETAELRRIRKVFCYYLKVKTCLTFDFIGDFAHRVGTTVRRNYLIVSSASNDSPYGKLRDELCGANHED